MDKLKPCPFCGEKVTEHFEFGSAPESEPSSIFTCACNFGEWIIDDEDWWNTRPIEDALRLKLDKARDALAKLTEYRRRNTFNFQLEKLDSYVDELSRALAELED